MAISQSVTCERVDQKSVSLETVVGKFVWWLSFLAQLIDRKNNKKEGPAG